MLHANILRGPQFIKKKIPGSRDVKVNKLLK